MFFVLVLAKTRLGPGFRASFVEVRELTTAKATQNACNAKEPENQAMDYLVPGVEA